LSDGKKLNAFPYPLRRNCDEFNVFNLTPKIKLRNTKSSKN
jgi:hypothetical protein